MTRATGLRVLLAALAAGTVVSWPSALARVALIIAYHGAATRAAESVAILSPVVGVATAIAAVWLCRRGRTRLGSFAIVGVVGGLVAGGAFFAAWELLYRTYASWTEPIAVAVRTTVLGAFWAAPVAIPTGALAGVIVWWLGTIVGVAEPSWREAGARPRVLLVVAVMVVQVFVATALRRISVA